MAAGVVAQPTVDPPTHFALTRRRPRAYALSMPRLRGRPTPGYAWPIWATAEDHAEQGSVHEVSGSWCRLAGRGRRRHPGARRGRRRVHARGLRRGAGRQGQGEAADRRGGGGQDQARARGCSRRRCRGQARPRERRHPELRAHGLLERHPRRRSGRRRALRRHGVRPAVAARHRLRAPGERRRRVQEGRPLRPSRAPATRPGWRTRWPATRRTCWTR